MLAGGTTTPYQLDDYVEDMLTHSIGGSLGWQTKGSLDPDFEKVAFELPPSPVTSPTFERVKTGFGYHIIMVEERK